MPITSENWVHALGRNYYEDALASTPAAVRAKAATAHVQPRLSPPFRPSASASELGAAPRDFEAAR